MDFEGMPKVVFNSNTIQYNENYLPNAFVLQCSIYDQQTDTSSPTELTELQEVLDRAKSIITVRGAETLSFTSDIFEGNSVIDEWTPYGTLSNDIQSSGILVQDFKTVSGGNGGLTISAVQFSSNKGFSSATSTASASFSSVSGFKKYLIAL